ncbi:MAG: thioredoxin family protein [Oligoflexia bacterium]|nr:thioredoxin family protein [Oligoflexia bacterium]
MNDPAGAFADLPLSTQLFAAGAAGLITGLTPCAYLLLPLTITLLGTATPRSWRQHWASALSYLAGLAMSLFLAGVLMLLAAAYTGALFSDEWAGIGAALIYFVLAILTLDLFKLAALERLRRHASNLAAGSHTGTFLVGGCCGLITLPTIGPIMQLALRSLTGISALSAQLQLLLTFCLALLAPLTPFVLLAGVIKRRPSSRGWLNAVKFTTAVCMLVFAVAAVWPYFGSWHDPTLNLPIDAVALCGVVALLLAWGSYRFNFTPIRLMAAGVLAFSLSPLLSSARPPVELKWNSSLEAAQADALSRKTVVMLEFDADWCKPCEQFEQQVFKDRAVSLKLREFALAREDLSLTSQSSAELSQRFELGDLPAILFLGTDGKEIAQSRVTALMSPAAFLLHLAKIKP